MKNNMLIHKMADWLERKYLSQNTLSAFSKVPWYDTIPNTDNTPTTTIRVRKGRQNQPIMMALGMAPSKMPLSYTSMASL